MHFNTTVQPFPLRANWPKTALHNYRSSQSDMLVADWPRGGIASHDDMFAVATVIYVDHIPQGI